MFHFYNYFQLFSGGRRGRSNLFSSFNKSQLYSFCSDDGHCNFLFCANKSCKFCLFAISFLFFLLCSNGGFLSLKIATRFRFFDKRDKYF